MLRSCRRATAWNTQQLPTPTLTKGSHRTAGAPAWLQEEPPYLHDGGGFRGVGLWGVLPNKYTTHCTLHTLHTLHTADLTHYVMHTLHTVPHYTGISQCLCVSAVRSAHEGPRQCPGSAHTAKRHP